MAKKLALTADKVRKRKRAFLTTKIVILVLFMVMLVAFILLSIVFSVNRFTISLDSKLQDEDGIVIYTSMKERASQRKLYADTVPNMDNITYDWIDKEDLTGNREGSHNGNNYIAYTFYIENQGKVMVNYWYDILIDDVIRDVDEAIRVVVRLNDEEIIYAKKNKTTGEAEVGTTSFKSDSVVVSKGRKGFNVGDIDKFTIVIYLEGEDPDCLNNIIGGEIKMRMDIREEHVDDEK